jgi:hypothetical protein
MHRLPQCHRGNPQVECHNIHQVNQYDTPLSPRVFIMQDIHHVFPNLNIQSDNNKTSKGKDSIHHNKGREGRNIIWSIYINKAHDTSRSWHLKITRERDETHSYWYIPLTSRVDYSLLVMVAAGMMKMASGDDSPLRQGARTGSRLVFGGYRGVRRRSPSSRLTFGGFWIYVNFQRWNHAKGGLRGPTQHQGAPQGGRPGVVWAPWASSGPSSKLPGALSLYKKSSKSFVAFGELLFLHKKQHHGSSAENSVSPG